MMTRLLPALLLLLGMLLPLRAQRLNDNREHFDHNWKTCDESVSSFYRVVTRHNDSIWLIGDYYRFAGAQMSGFAKRSDGTGRYGTWTWYHPNGRRSELRTYVEDIQQGTATEWHANGQRSDSAFYRNGKIEGTSLEWHANGQRSDSSFFHNGRVDGLSQKWHPNGHLASKGIYEQGIAVGIHRKWYDDGTLEAETTLGTRTSPLTWTWFDRTGRMTAVETYHNGKTIDPVYYEPDGSTHSDTTRAESFGGEEWNIQIARLITYPKLERNNNLEGTVMLQFKVKEDGSVSDVAVNVPATPGMNAEAVRAIQTPGLFTPPRLHNKPWSFNMVVPVSFRLSSD